MKLALFTLSLIITAAATEQEKNDYIHVFPTSTTITLNYTDLSDSMSNSSRDYGKFECATRPDVMPLWIINGVSATSVKMTPGFENVSYLLFPLTENHTLTLLYVPGSVETNNSIIRCAAVLDLQVVAYSDPVNFTVFCPDSDAVCGPQDDIVTTATGSSSPLPTDKEKNTTDISPHLIAGICAIVVLVLLVVVVSTALVVLVCILLERRKRRTRQFGHSDRVVEGNVYWDAGNRDLLEESISTIKSEDNI